MTKECVEWSTNLSKWNCVICVKCERGRAVRAKCHAVISELVISVGYLVVISDESRVNKSLDYVTG